MKIVTLPQTFKDGPSVTDWMSEMEYEIGDLVRYQDKVWKITEDHTSDEKFDWNKIVNIQNCIIYFKPAGPGLSTASWIFTITYPNPGKYEYETWVYAKKPAYPLAKDKGIEL